MTAPMRKYQLVAEVELRKGGVVVRTCNRLASVAVSEAFSLLRAELSLPEDYQFKSEEYVFMHRSEKLIGSF